MSSVALAEWQTTATARLDELERVHAAVRGPGPGRRWTTRQLNLSLSVALLAQFQTYCRGLHDEAVEIEVAAATPTQAQLLRRLLRENRGLDRGNPTLSTLADDYGRLGVQLLPLLKGALPSTSAALQQLETLVRFRNAVAHGNDAQLAALIASGQIAANLASFHRHRQSVSSLVTTMDRVVANGLAADLQIRPPW